MRSTLRRRFDLVLRLSPAQPLFRWRAGGKLAVLTYHVIGDPDRFARHLDILTSRYRLVDLDEACDALLGRRGLLRPAALVTFDDGDRSLMDVALPLLKERGVPAAVFVVAGLLDTDTPYWWVEVEYLVAHGGQAPGFEGLEPAAIVAALKRVPDTTRQAVLEQLRHSTAARPLRTPQLRSADLPTLVSAGIAVGNHTLTHPCLPRCDDEVVRTEVQEAAALLARHLGRVPRAFAYPNGDVDDRSRAAVAAAGHDVGFLFDHRLSAVPASDPLQVSRLRMNAAASPDRFKVILSGLHPAVHRLRGAVRTRSR